MGIKSGALKDSFKTDRRESTGLAVLNTGRQKCQPGHFWGPGMRDHYLIHVITAGKGTYQVQGKTLRLQAGDIFLIYPDTVVYYEADRSDPWEYYWVGFQGGDAPYLVDLCGFRRATLVLNAGTSLSALRDALTAIHNTRGRDIADDLRMTGALYIFLSRMIALNRSVERTNRRPLEKAVRYICDNFSRQISVRQIADFAGISRSQLYRLFVQHLHVTPIEYLLEKRISTACTLFNRYQVSVSEAAYSVGFSDPLYFSRMFKKLRGVSPSTFREKCQ